MMVIDDFYRAENWLYEEWERRVDAHEDADDVTGLVRTTSGEFMGSFAEAESDADADDGIASIGFRLRDGSYREVKRTEFVSLEIPD